MLNEFIFQYADFSNDITANSTRPLPDLPERRRRRPEPQHAADDRSRRSGSSATTSRGTSPGMGGIGHDFKAGVNFINEPRLYITFNSGTRRPAAHLPHRRRQRADLEHHASTTATRRPTSRSSSTPFYLQDDWAVTDRLTVNLGLRYDLIDGLPVRPVEEPQLRDHAERRQGRPARPGIKGLENFGKDPKNDTNNWQPRLGFAYDVVRQRQGRRPRRLGHLHGHGLHQLERAVRGQRRHRQGLRRGGLDRQPAGHPQPRRLALPGRPAAVEHRQPEPGAARCRCSASSPTRGCRCPTRGRPRSAGRTS